MKQPFEPEQLVPFFQKYQIQQALIAYSGGLDSHVLLNACAKLKQSIPNLQLRAVYIDHGLQAISKQWAHHCQHQCTLLGISFQALSITLNATQKNIEAQARDARYKVFQDQLQQSEVLLTAHHANDQAETFLLNLMRGSGIEGLAAMPEVRVFAHSYLIRPLLPYSREQLQQYAQQQGLNYIEDPTNQELLFNRNYVRHKVLPLLQQRWSNVLLTINRSVRLQAETGELIDELLQEKYQLAQGSLASTLSIGFLKTQSPVIQKALIRFWLREQGFLMPSEKKLKHVMQDVLHAKQDAQPCVSWAGCEIRRFQDDLFAMPPLLPLDLSRQAIWQAKDNLQWESTELTPQMVCDFQPPFTVCYRQGGELIRYRGRTVSLKKWLNAQKISPWERERLPLVYQGDKLVFIPNIYKAKP